MSSVVPSGVVSKFEFILLNTVPLLMCFCLTGDHLLAKADSPPRKYSPYFCVCFWWFHDGSYKGGKKADLHVCSWFNPNICPWQLWKAGVELLGESTINIMPMFFIQLIDEWRFNLGARCVFAHVLRNCVALLWLLWVPLWIIRLYCELPETENHWRTSLRCNVMWRLCMKTFCYYHHSAPS